jgi:hypothetical protein
VESGIWKLETGNRNLETLFFRVQRESITAKSNLKLSLNNVFVFFAQSDFEFFPNQTLLL